MYLNFNQLKLLSKKLYYNFYTKNSNSVFAWRYLIIILVFNLTNILSNEILILPD